MFADRVFETTTITGTGSYVLLGAQSDYRGFADAFDTDDIVGYHCRSQDGSIWESGWGILNTSTNTITRNLLESSTGSLIVWGSGTKFIYSASMSVIENALLAGNLGAARPGWLPAGGTWIYDGATPWVVYLFDGTDDIPIGELNASTNAFRAYAGTGKAISGTLAEALNTALGSNVASAATANIWSTTGNTVHVTGTTTITSLGTAPQAGAVRQVVFDGALTLTNGANLILPGGANITTAAGDAMAVLAETTTQHRVVSYTKADGTAVAVVPVVPPDESGWAKFWVNFNGTGTVAIRDSFNVVSITDLGTGDYSVVIDTDFAAADWAAFGFSKTGGSAESPTLRIISQGANSIRVLEENNAGADIDTDLVCVGGFGVQ